MDRVRDGHKIQLIIEDSACRAKVICPHREKGVSKICDVDFCGIQEEIVNVGFECFDSEPYEVTEVPFEIEWWTEGSYEDTELWIAPVKGENDGRS